MEAQYVIIAFNIVIAIAGFFAGMVIRDLSSAVKELREADTAMLKGMSLYSTKEEVKEIRSENRDLVRDMRDEQRESFRLIFDKLDAITAQVATKMDRREVGR